MLDARISLMKQMAYEAGSCLRSHFGDRSIGIKKKGELDLVTVADEAAERICLTSISREFPDDHILAEESGTKPGANQWQWIIDPLDGTTNFAHGLPQFCVSIAVARDGLVEAGIVYDPIKDELFEARRGSGAFLNGVQIHIGDRRSLNESLAVTGFSYDRRERMDELMDRVRRMLMNCQGFRRFGSAALDLAYIAAGRFDVFLENGLNAWDIAAGQLLVTEAGGMVCLFNGESLDLGCGEIVACNPHLREQALEHLL